MTTRVPCPQSARVFGTAVRAGFVLIFSLSPVVVPAQAPTPRDLAELSLDDLMNVKVTSVSKKEQKLSRTGAAVHVLTQDDIRRSGATNLPDLLRLVPGVEVQQVQSGTWAISIRGFTDRFANKVLVLVDGRSVYNPVYSGVVWEALDVVLEDIERIEVIRGPGGTVWGANAMNGVINIITKKAEDTQGGLFSAGSGSEQKALGVMRYGGALGRRGFYRVFGRYVGVSGSVWPTGGDAADAWHATHGGFRSDWSLSTQDALTVQGEGQSSTGAETVFQVYSRALPAAGIANSPKDFSSGNLLLRWDHSLRGGSETTVQIYDDYFRGVEQGIHYSQNIVDTSFQHHLAMGARHDVVWGGGLRVASTNLSAGFSASVVPPRQVDNLFSMFLQDEIRILDSLWITAGSKFEHNDYTGFEFEPSAQLVWMPDRRHAIWVSAARAIRQPSRIDFGLRNDSAIVPVPGLPFGVVTTFGNPNLRAERLYDFEVGYRGQMGKHWSLDLAAFAGLYRDLVSAAPGAPYLSADSEPAHLVLPVVFGNDARGRSSGVELFVNWNANRRWRLSYGYSLVDLDAQVVSSNPGATLYQTPANTPEHQFQVRSQLNLSRSLEWDHAFFRIERPPSGLIPSYNRLDSRLGWRISEAVEFSVTGQNLLVPRHAEFPDQYGLQHTLIERSVIGKITWRF